MISINKHQCLAPISPFAKAHVLANKQVTFFVDERRYLIDHDLKKVVREHPRGNALTRACEATEKLFSEGSVRSIARHLTRELFEAPMDRQKQLQAPLNPTRKL